LVNADAVIYDCELTHAVVAIFVELSAVNIVCVMVGVVVLVNEHTPLRDTSVPKMSISEADPCNVLTQ